MKLTNRWNLFIYRLWAPIYDSTVNHFFMPGRARAMELLALQPGERVLIAGVGTGVDMQFIPDGVKAVGIDLSPQMLSKAAEKVSRLHLPVLLVQGDAQNPHVAHDSFDAAIFNLILSVVPDGRACLRSSLLALKPGGRAVIFDKFLPDESVLKVERRFINLFSSLFGTDITRRFGDIAAGCPCQVVLNEPSLMGGTYRVMLIQKRNQAEESGWHCGQK